MCSSLLPEHGVKGGDKGLSQPEGEDKLGSSHEELREKGHKLVPLCCVAKAGAIFTYLGCQALEERRETLLAGHVGHDTHAALGVVEVAVLDTGLDDIEGSGDDKRGGGTGNGGDEVLEPAGLVVIGEVEEVLLGEGGSSEELYNCQSTILLRNKEKVCLTAKDPGALRAAVQPQPR